MSSGRVRELKIDVAQIPLALEVEQTSLAERIMDDYAGFLAPASDPWMTIRVRTLGDARYLPLEPGPWQIQLSLRGERLMFTSYFESGWIDFRSRRGELEMAPEASIENFLRVVYGYLGLERDTLLLHASGVVKQDRAYVFFGPSGSGKTTTAKLSADQIILSDDMVMIKRMNGGVKAFGVPFKGELPEAPRNNVSADLEGIFRLHKDEEHFTVGMSTSKALADLVACVPYLMTAPALIGRVLSLGLEIVTTVPVKELHFQRDPGFWSVISSEAV